MRPHALVPLALLTTVVAAGCSPLEFETPGTEPALTADHYRTDYPPSELSVEGPDLCVDGERGGEDCTAPQALRWSIPLGEEHDDEEYLFPVDLGATVQSTRHHLFEERPQHRLHIGEETLYHVEGDSLRAVDLDTGEQRWTADLRGDAPRTIPELHMAGNHLVAELHTHVPDSGRAETLIIVDASDGSEVSRLPVEDKLVGITDTGVVITESERVVLRGVDAFSGDEVWRFEADVPDSDHDRVRWSTGFDGETLSLVVERRPEDEWDLLEVERLDADTGEELPAPGPEDVGEEELREMRSTTGGLELSDLRTSSAAFEDDIELYRYLWQDADGDHEHDHPDTFEEGRLLGIGMAVRNGRDGEPTVGVSCAPDAVRPQDPPADALPHTVICDNPRLFVVNP